MNSRLAIIAGQGALPHQLAAAYPTALFVHFDALEDEVGIETSLLSYERFGELFQVLQDAGVSDVVFAGGLARPALNPANFDAKMMQLAPGFMAAMQGGDDGLLRAVVATFEDESFTVKGAHELLPDLTAHPGLLAGPAPSDIDRRDAQRARAILNALGPLDVGQGAVVADGQAIGVETAQGTDAMLAFVAQTPAKLLQRAKGVLVKAPKPEQDLRIDMPAIGPGTIAAAADAGLSGIVIDAHKVLLIDREATLAAAQEAGLFLMAETP